MASALPLLDPVAGLDEDRDHLAVHRRLDGIAAVEMFEIDIEGIEGRDAGLAAVVEDDHAVIRPTRNCAASRGMKVAGAGS